MAVTSSSLCELLVANTNFFLILCSPYTCGLYKSLFHFQPVETFSVYTDDGTLGNESVRVYIFHHPEYFYRLAFVGKDDQYLHVVFTVPADTVEYRYTAMGFFGDAVGNLFIFFGENKELNGLPGTVDYVIQYKSMTNKVTKPNITRRQSWNTT